MAYCLSDDAQLRLLGPRGPGHRDVFSVPVPNNERDAECSPHARSDGSRTSREMQSGLLSSGVVLVSVVSDQDSLADPKITKRQ